MGGAPQHPDVWRAIDAQPTAAKLADTLEVRGRTPAQARLRRRFLRFVPIRPGQRVPEPADSSGRVGHVVARAASVDEAGRLADRVIAGTRVKVS